MQHKKKFFFDLDGTLTPSRQLIKAHMLQLLSTIDREIVVVSGSKNSQIRKQIGDIKIFSLGQNGNHAVDTADRLLWNNVLTLEEKKLAEQHIAHIQPVLQHYIPDTTDLVEDRGSQISFSIYGHNAPPEEKKACDGDFKKRQTLLAQFPFVSESMEVQMGGSTCLDYFKKNSNKGTNVAKLIKKMGWSKDECIYFGDALFSGGNDETVVGVIDIVKVRDEDDTFKILQNHFGQ